MDLSNDNIIHVKGKKLEYIQFRKLNEFGIKHAYTLKNDGINFRINNNRENAKKSYEILCEELEVDYTKLIRPHQTHTDTVKCIECIPSESELEDVDGTLTNEKGYTLATTNADCILYLVYDPIKRVIGSIHSGWRGTHKRIIEKTIDIMQEKYESRVEDIYVFICPSIRECHFEVEKDVKDLFEERFGYLEQINEIILEGNREGKYYIDTVYLNNILLQNKGIKENHIIDSGLCSVCNKNIIGSYRVEGKMYTAGTAVISL